MIGRKCWPVNPTEAGEDIEINRLEQRQGVANHVAGLEKLEGGYPLQVRLAAVVLPEHRLAVPRHLDQLAKPDEVVRQLLPRKVGEVAALQVQQEFKAIGSIVHNGLYTSGFKQFGGILPSKAAYQIFGVH